MSNRKDCLAAQRISRLLDENSFVELGSLVTARSTDFNLSQTQTPSDGVITGHGLIDGSLVFVYSQDVSVLNGTIGEMHAKKIASVYDMAMKMGAPVIGFLDCAGIRGCTGWIRTDLRKAGAGIRSDPADLCGIWNLWRRTFRSSCIM